MWDFIFILFYIIAVEAFTELLVKSEISKRFIKKPLFKKRDNKFFYFIHDLLDCGYCTSIWVASIAIILFILDLKVIDTLILFLVFHRLSNLFHFFVDWLDEKRIGNFNYLEKEND